MLRIKSLEEDNENLRFQVNEKHTNENRLNELSNKLGKQITLQEDLSIHCKASQQRVFEVEALCESQRVIIEKLKEELTIVLADRTNPKETDQLFQLKKENSSLKSKLMVLTEQLTRFQFTTLSPRREQKISNTDLIIGEQTLSHDVPSICIQSQGQTTLTPVQNDQPQMTSLSIMPSLQDPDMDNAMCAQQIDHVKDSLRLIVKNKELQKELDATKKKLAQIENKRRRNVGIQTKLVSDPAQKELNQQAQELQRLSKMFMQYADSHNEIERSESQKKNLQTYSNQSIDVYSEIMQQSGLVTGETKLNAYPTVIN